MPSVLLITEIAIAFISFCFGVASSVFTVNRKHRHAFWTKMAASACFLLTGFINAFLCSDGIYAVAVLAGLFYGFCGDAFLAAPTVLPGRERVYQAGGVLCFAMGHILYCAALIGQYGVSVWLFLTAAALLGGAIAWTVAEKVNAGPVHLAGVLYMAIACTMAGSAVHALISRFSASSLLFAVGGMLFVLSDTMLIIRAFGKRKSLLMHYGVLMTYFPAQCLIAISLLLFPAA